jgi:hypothetical protein
MIECVYVAICGRAVQLPIIAQTGKFLTAGWPTLPTRRDEKGRANYRSFRLDRTAIEAGEALHARANLWFALDPARAVALEESHVKKLYHERIARVVQRERQAKQAMEEASHKPAGDFFAWFDRMAERLRDDPPEPGDPKDLEFFGLNTSATVDDLRRVYRCRAIKSHPDAGGNGAEFREMQSKFDSALRFVVAGR